MVQLEDIGPRQSTSSTVQIRRKGSEGELVAAVAAGEREAAEQLIKQTYEQIFASLVRLCGDREKAADLTQDTYRVAWSSLASFEGRARFSTWLYRIAYNTFLNQSRRPSLMTQLDDAKPIVDPAPGLEARVSQAEQDERLRSFVLELPDELRLVITARYWAELPTAEIASLENISRSAVRKRLTRARRALRRRFDQGDAS